MLNPLAIHTQFEDCPLLVASLSNGIETSMNRFLCGGRLRGSGSGAGARSRYVGVADDDVESQSPSRMRRQQQPQPPPRCGDVDAGPELSMGWVGLGHKKWTHGQLCAGRPVTHSDLRKSSHCLRAVADRLLHESYDDTRLYSSNATATRAKKLACGTVRVCISGVVYRMGQQAKNN